MKTPEIQIANPVTGLSEHKHCEVCGKSIATDGRVCSPECVTKLHEAIRMKKRSVYVVMAMVFLLALLSMFGRQIFAQ